MCMAIIYNPRRPCLVQRYIILSLYDSNSKLLYYIRYEVKVCLSPQKYLMYTCMRCCINILFGVVNTHTIIYLNIIIDIHIYLFTNILHNIQDERIKCGLLASYIYKYGENFPTNFPFYTHKYFPNIFINRFMLCVICNVGIFLRY